MKNGGFRRWLALSGIFFLALAGAYALRVWWTGGDLRELLPALFQRKTAVSSAAFTLPESAPLELRDVEFLARLNNEYAKLTTAVVPSVVSIDTRGSRLELQQDRAGRTTSRNMPVQGEGSGIIVTREGHVITNLHVVANQNQIQVTLHHGKIGKMYPATLIGEDQLLDIAVLKIQSDEIFTPLKFGDSSEVKVGQIVFAVGNPFGLGETVTQGIISAKERSLSDSQVDLFQTDAAINPGNSGGPLVNLRGEIIGINVSIFSQNKETPSFQGVGFSIPSNDVKDSLLQILKGGKPVRGYFGINARDIDDPMRELLHFNGATGIAILGVAAESPAEGAGIHPLDVILSYNDIPLTSFPQFKLLVERTKVGSSVNLKVWRQGDLLDRKARILENNLKTDSSGNALTPHSRNAPTLEDAVAAIGITVRDLTPTETYQGYRGVIVTSISTSAQAYGKILPGDLIVTVNDIPVTLGKDFYVYLAASASTQATALRLVRDGQSLQISVPKISSIRQ